MAAKKKTKKQSKASFVRELPTGLSAAEAVEMAKAAGMTLDVGYVYNIRSTAKSSGNAKRGHRAGGARAKAPPPKTKTNGAAPKRVAESSAETLLKAVGAELGLASAIRILEAERARVRAVLGK
jgi:hypothetical protein